MNRLGEELLSRCKSSSSPIVLCAPFIKAHVIEKMLTQVSAGMSVEVFTRWRPEEVAKGVSDLDVFDVVRSFGGTTFLVDCLHAKYYRFGSAVLVGSANLTSKALGWASSSNLEILTPSDYSEFSIFESTLRSLAHPATELEKERVRDLAISLGEPSPLNRFPSSDWIPVSREPGRLFRLYSGDKSGMTDRGLANAYLDFNSMALPFGYDENQFTIEVRKCLAISETVQAIDRFIATPRRFGEVSDYLGSIHNLSGVESDQAWQTIMRWLIEFCGDRYVVKVRRYSEVISKI